ncbi:MAG TPA: endonuclease III [Candidatus Polarisedimenticolia bacterium]|nr:endonuclease III [Candidatus Polarisedimenticolia bacterium]
MKKRQTALPAKPRIARILEALRRDHPTPRVELDHANPLQLVIATILSAQCTDARVNRVTPDLFQRYPDAAAFARARPADLEQAIRSTGFFRAKARSILGCCRDLVEKHAGRVPSTMEELTRLPGVGRKTANVVLGAGYGIASGIVVDTHMARVTRRLGLTRRDDPEGVEQDLMRAIPRAEWIFFSIAMVLHGRYVCLARRPRCGECSLNPHCPSSHLEAEATGVRGLRRTGARRKGAAVGRSRPAPPRS